MGQDLRTLRRFDELVDAAGAPGTIVRAMLEAEIPYVVFHWGRSAGRGYPGMKATLFKGGDFSAGISTSDTGDEFIVNHFGACLCANCKPPVIPCGHGPSWVPHDLHWDNFDCGYTVTGPQGLNHGQC